MLKLVVNYITNSLSDTLSQIKIIINLKMSSDLTYLSTDKCLRVPVLDPEDYGGWEMMFQAYVGFNEWELFEKAEPELDAIAYAALLTSSQDPAPESKKFENKLRVTKENGN